jgi:DNA-binding CsgD family transcriptional regulator
MVHIELGPLSRVAEMLTVGYRLTPAKRAEVMRIAQGFTCNESASAANVSVETIRARRKRICRKFRVAGAGETLSALLALSLRLLAGPV